MASFELTQCITLLANCIYENVSRENAAILAAIFTQLGDTIATILVIDEKKGV